MRALVNTAPGALELLERPTPEPGPGEVRIRTLACGICATDLERIAGWSRTPFPSIPGHEWCGVVDAVGPDVDASLVGMRCVGENVRRDGGEVGFEHPGGYGEFFLTEPHLLLPVPGHADPAAATLLEPLAVAVRGLRRARIPGAPSNVRSPALVIGDGPIGLLLAMLLHAAGVKEIALAGGRPARLAAGRRLGASKTFNYHETPLGRIAGESGFIAEASGSADALDAAVDLAPHGARILVIGDYGPACARFAWNTVLHKELELVGSNASHGAWTEAVRLAFDAEPPLPLARLVTHVFPVDEFEAAFDTARHVREAIKVVLAWES
ncbi:MAG: zinc-dependent alcohol dehydrogenase [Kiritimatiellia bacterium]|jgi:L-iditol 2-dehydrogenase